MTTLTTFVEVPFFVLAAFILGGISAVSICWLQHCYIAYLENEKESDTGTCPTKPRRSLIPACPPEPKPSTQTPTIQKIKPDALRGMLS